MKYFAAVQSVFIMVGVLENKFINEDIEDTTHIFVAIMVLINSLTHIGICQLSLLVSYVTIWVYVTVRFVLNTELDGIG